MSNQQLLDYIKERLKQGASKEQIRASLIENGWPLEEIDKAFSLSLNSSPIFQSLVPQATTATLLGVTILFNQAVAICKQKLRIFLGIMIIPMLISIVLPAVLSIAGIFTFASELSSIGRMSAVTYGGLFFLVVLVSQVWGQTALLYAIKDSQGEVGVAEAYRRGSKKILPYFWISILSIPIIFGGFSLLVIPGVIFTVWFSLSIFVMIAEDLNGMNALLKSREYVKGKWGDVAWRLFFVAAVSFLVTWISGLILGFLLGKLGTEIVRFAGGLFLTPFVMTYLYLVYGNLKAIKGEIAFSPTGSQKAVFLAVGAFGILIVYAIFSLLRFFKDLH